MLAAINKDPRHRSQPRKKMSFTTKILYSAFGIGIIVLIISLTAIFAKDVELIDRSNSSVYVDLGRPIGTFNMQYGVNEDDNWMDFVWKKEVTNLHKEINSKYIRVWVSSQAYRESTIPYNDGEYNFWAMDSFVNAVLEVDAIPFVVFAHAPGTFGEGHGNPVPDDIEGFANYVGVVVDHYRQACEQDWFSKPCDVNDWYFEIWNEPFGDEWWEDEVPAYSQLFNSAYNSIKPIAPASKVGGYSGTFVGKEDRLEQFLAYSSPDFVSIHHYGNVLHSSEKQKMKDVRFLSYDSIKSLRAFIDSRAPPNTVEIIESEYSSDFRDTHMGELDEQFTAAWYMAALIGHAQSQEIAIELFYSGTSNRYGGGFGMWSLEDDSVRLWPVFLAKKIFTSINTPGSTIYETKTENSLEVLALKSKQGTFLTLVNKENRQREIPVGFSSRIGSVRDVKTGATYQVDGDHISFMMQPYEVGFYRLVLDE